MLVHASTDVWGIQRDWIFWKRNYSPTIPIYETTFSPYIYPNGNLKVQHLLGISFFLFLQVCLLGNHCFLGLFCVWSSHLLRNSFPDLSTSARQAWSLCALILHPHFASSSWQSSCLRTIMRKRSECIACELHGTMQGLFHWLQRMHFFQAFLSWHCILQKLFWGLELVRSLNNIYFLPFSLSFLRWVLMQPFLTSSILCSHGWSWTSDLPYDPFQESGLQACKFIPSPFVSDTVVKRWQASESMVITHEFVRGTNCAGCAPHQQTSQLDRLLLSSDWRRFPVTPPLKIGYTFLSIKTNLKRGK